MTQAVLRDEELEAMTKSEVRQLVIAGYGCAVLVAALGKDGYKRLIEQLRAEESAGVDKFAHGSATPTYPDDLLPQ